MYKFVPLIFCYNFSHNIINSFNEKLIYLHILLFLFSHIKKEA
nr:MAG TPA: hypothetical protein [Caudoviricetes sp.]